MTEKDRRAEILRRLEQVYPDAKPGLDYRNPFELLIATILSAQCTDVRVNKITAVLFEAYPNAHAMAAAPVDKLEDIIRSCGFFRMKSKHILQTCRILVDEHQGQVPSQREVLEKLPGVGRKTANVVLSNAFGVPAIAVDTHVFRVSNRLGLAKAKTVEKTEQQLMARIPKQQWTMAHHWLIWHGRRVCAARNPACETCTLYPLCKNPVKQTTQSDLEGQ